MRERIQGSIRLSSGKNNASRAFAGGGGSEG